MAKSRVRFEGISGRIDQGAGILFNLKPNGDYLTVRANPSRKQSGAVEVREGQALLGEMDSQHADSNAPVARPQGPDRRHARSKAISTASSTWSTCCRQPYQRTHRPVVQGR